MSGPPTWLEGVYTPTAHEGAPGRGDGTGSPPGAGACPGSGTGPHAIVGGWRYSRGRSRRGTAAPPGAGRDQDGGIAARHCWHRTQNNAAWVSADVHDGGQLRCVGATVATKSLKEPEACGSDVPLDVAPRGCRPLSRSSLMQCIASAAHKTMQLGSLLLYIMAASCGALVRRWLPCR